MRAASDSQRRVALLAVSVACFGFTQRFHAWNFDALTYAAVAHHWADGAASDAEVHRRVFADLKAVAPESEIAALTTSSPYRRGVFEDPAQLAVARGFYSNKPLLDALTTLGVLAGLNAFRALFLVTGLAWALFAALFFFAVQRGVFPWLAALLLLLSPAWVGPGLLGTPDSLAGLTTFAGGWLLLERRTGLAFAAFALACLARPDSVLLCGALLFFAAARDRRWAPAAMALGLAFGNALAQHLLHARSWSALFINSFVTRVTTAEQLADPVVTAEAYFRVVGRLFSQDQVLFASTWTLFAAASLAACRRPGARLVHATIWVAALAHVVIFPLLDDRYFFPHYALIAFLLLRPRARPRPDPHCTGSRASVR